jgi:hypothetical protein
MRKIYRDRQVRRLRLDLGGLHITDAYINEAVTELTFPYRVRKYDIGKRFAKPSPLDFRESGKLRRL